MEIQYQNFFKERIKNAKVRKFWPLYKKLESRNTNQNLLKYKKLIEIQRLK
jgi:hypothetical protein